jgi:hypothetical protein
MGSCTQFRRQDGHGLVIRFGCSQGQMLCLHQDPF